MDSDGMVYQGWREVVKPVTDRGDTISISQRVRGNGQPDDDIASQLQTLADFMISVDLAQLTYLEIATGGFQGSFQASVGDIQMSDIDPFYARLQEIADQEESVLAAINALESRAKLAIAVTPQDLNGPLASKVSACPRLGVWDSLVSFFSFKGEEDKLAQQEILSVSAAMTPGEKEEAFYWLSTERVGGAQNYDEFLAQLQAGNLEDITRIRSDLHTGGPYQGVYQTINPDSNRPGGETIHRAGAELVTRGAALHVDVVKEVLSTVFPGMDKGFEYADKAAEWAEFVRNMYINPLGTLRDMTIDHIQSEIMENIQLDLMSAIPDLDEETAEELAGTLTNEIITSHTTLITTLIEAQAGAQPTTTQEDDTVECTGVGEAEYQLAAAQLGLTPKQPADPETASYIVCTDHATGLAVSVDLVEGNAETDEDAVIPTGVYKGETNSPQIWSHHATLQVGKNEIILIVEEDGTTYGEIIATIMWTEVFDDGELYIHNELTGEINGRLADRDGTLIGTFANHYYVTGFTCPPCDDHTMTFDIPYEIHVSDNIMSATPILEDADSDVITMYSFELTRQ
jgi:hypothetical protein